MDKVDFKKTLGGFKAKKGQFEILEIPEAQYLMIDGEGDPNETEDFEAAIITLYPVAYKLKFMSKIDLKKDYVVPPMEGLWWADDMTSFTNRRKSEWKFTLMLMVPGWITEEMYEAALDKVEEKQLPRHDEIRLETLNEGLVVQTLHIGPYDDEGPVLDEMHNSFIPDNNLSMKGKHHEIYLGDPRKGDQSKLKTILRQPVERKSS